MRHVYFLSLSVLLSCAAYPALALPTDAAAPTGAALQITKPIYEWRTDSEREKDTGEFNHCLVKNMYDNGTILMIAENADGVRRLALHFPQNKLKQDEHFDLTIQVDKRDTFPVEAVAVSPQILTIGIPDILPQQMRKGEALYVRGPNDEVVYTLKGVDGAVMALQDCIEANKGTKTDSETAMNTPAQVEKTDDALIDQMKLADAGAAKTAALPTPPIKTEAKEVAPKVADKVPSDLEPLLNDTPTKAAEKPVIMAEAVAPKAVEKPVEKPVEKIVEKAPAKATVKPTPAPKPVVVEKKVEKKIAVVDPNALPEPYVSLFNKAGLRPGVLSIAPNKKSTRPLDYAWTTGDLFIGIQKQRALSNGDFMNAATNSLKLLKNRCPGPFVAEAATPSHNMAKKFMWMVAETACAPNNANDTIAALLFTNSDDGLILYFFEAPAKQGALAIKARDAILNSVTE